MERDLRARSLDLRCKKRARRSRPTFGNRMITAEQSTRTFKIPLPITAENPICFPARDQQAPCPNVGDDQSLFSSEIHPSMNPH